MSNYLAVFILVFLTLIPPALILLGVLLRKERYGFGVFIVGWAITSAFLLHYPSDLLATFICRLLDSLGITATFHDTSIIDLPLFCLSICCGFKLFRFISKPRKSAPRTTARTSSESTPQSNDTSDGESIYFMEAANGTTVAVPESELDAWLAHQEELRKKSAPVELTENEKILRDMILEQYYGSKKGDSDDKS